MNAPESRFGTVALTGATSGIGAATAGLLATRADTLILQGAERPEDVAEQLETLRRGGATVHYVSCDFTSLDAVVVASIRIRELAPGGIDLLINDAAVPGAPERLLTPDGFERTLQVNALAPALLTRLLVPSLSPNARIVNVGSTAHRVERFHFDDIDLGSGYSPVAAYARAKLAMVTWSSLLAEEEAATSTTVVSLCPGLNDTPLSAAMMGRIGGPPIRGAEHVLFAATAAMRSGSYLENDRVVRPSAEVDSARNRERLTELYGSRLHPFAARGRR
ncbi:SDR family NAD(P)-dependent oxidoreductase [Microbacterium sp. SLBN-111]|uniref:SDR family NAD(P)-dependent oxidoreductase n=1 Tax=Microbacterium sp. SLBN-111 TaxID=3377733 RepID=UPI003C735DAB